MKSTVRKVLYEKFVRTTIVRKVSLPKKGSEMSDTCFGSKKWFFGHLKNRSGSKTTGFWQGVVPSIKKVEFTSFSITPKPFDMDLNWWRYGHLKLNTVFKKPTCRIRQTKSRIEKWTSNSCSVKRGICWSQRNRNNFFTVSSISSNFQDIAS